MKIGFAPIMPSYSSSRLRMYVEELPGLAVEAGRDVLGDAADLRVARVHAHAGRHLEQVEHAVALAEAVEEQADAAEVDRARAEEDQVVVQALQLGEERADPLAAARHLEAEQLLDAHHVHELVAEERVVVGPGRVRDRLPVRLLLHVLLDARVHVAELVVQADDGLAVERDHEAQHAVRRGVVRPEADLHQVRVADRAAAARTGVGQSTSAGVCPACARSIVATQTASENCTGSPPIG